MAKPREVKFLIFQGTTRETGSLNEYTIGMVDGMVVLDAVLEIQAKKAPDLGIRCNCSAGKCGSCSAEINGLPGLMCKTRLSSLDLDKPVVIRPLKVFPLIKDLVTNVAWNYETNEKITPFTCGQEGEWRMYQHEVDRIQEFRKCIECFLCQGTCHVIREHDKKDKYYGPRLLGRLANLAMHPLDEADRIKEIKEKSGIGYCNVTGCCNEVCPEHIKLTDNAIIPLKERVASAHYDPLLWLARRFRRGDRARESGSQRVKES